MSEEFVPYEVALKLKQLGFDEPCYSLCNSVGEFIMSTDLADYNKLPFTSAPSYSQAFRWFREKYSLFVNFPIDQTSKPKFCYHIVEYYEDEVTWEWKDNWGWSFLYRTYEEAELACLRKLIEIVKNK